MELAAEVREVVVVGRDLFAAPVDLEELNRAVKSDFGLRGAQLEGRVPGAAIGAVEARAERMRVAERRVDDVIRGHAEDELVRADIGPALVLRQQPVVCRLLQVKDGAEIVVTVGDPREDTLRGAGTSTGPGDEYRARESAAGAVQPARRASSRRRTICIAGWPPAMR